MVYSWKERAAIVYNPKAVIPLLYNICINLLCFGKFLPSTVGFF